MMRLLVRDGKRNPAVRQAASELVQGLRQKDWLAEIRAIHSFVQNRIRYTRDIRGVETLQIPERTLLNEMGDCDDKSVLAASLLEAIGHPTRFAAVAFQPGRFSHVFPETKLSANDKWIAVETTEPVTLGWRPKGIVNTLVIYN